MIIDPSPEVKFHHHEDSNAPPIRERIYRLKERNAGGNVGSYRISVADNTERASHTLLHFIDTKANAPDFGITNESLLAVVLDRLTCCQEGAFPCPENQVAIDGVSAALNALKHRSKRRFLSNMEGKQVENEYARPVVVPIQTNDDGTPVSDNHEDVGEGVEPESEPEANPDDASDEGKSDAKSEDKPEAVPVPKPKTPKPKTPSAK